MSHKYQENPPVQVVSYQHFNLISKSVGDSCYLNAANNQRIISSRTFHVVATAIYNTATTNVTVFECSHMKRENSCHRFNFSLQEH